MQRGDLQNLQPSPICDAPPLGEDGEPITAAHEIPSHEPTTGVDRATLLTTLSSTLSTCIAGTHNPQDIDNAINAAHEAISLSPATDEHDDTLLYSLAELLLYRFKFSGDSTDVREALSIHRKALDLRPPDHPERYHSVLSLAKALHTYFYLAGKIQDLLDAIEFGYLALSLFNPTCHDQPAFLTTVAELMLSSFKQTGLSSELDQCIEYAQEAVSCCPPESPARAASLDILARSLLSRYEERGEPIDLEAAIEYAQAHESLSHELTTDVNRATLTTTLSSVLFARLARTHDAQGIEIAVKAARKAIPLSPAADELDEIPLYSLAELLLRRFELSGDPTDVQEALSLHRKALVLRPPGHPERYHSVLSLAKALHTHFCYAGEPQDLTDAIEFGALALSLFDPTCHDQPAFLTAVAAPMLSRFKQTGLPSELDQCIEYAYEAVSCCPPESPMRAASLDILSRSLLSRYEERGELTDLEEAIEYAHEADSLCPEGHPDRPRALGSVAAGLLVRHERIGEPEDLPQSASLSWDAIQLCPRAAPLRLTLLNTVVPALTGMCAREREQSGLETCIELGDQALALCPPGHPDRPRSLINLAVAKCTLFYLAGRQEDVDDGIISLREAIELLPSGAVVRPVALGRLADALLFRFKSYKALDDIEESVARGKEALSACSPCAPARAKILDHLSDSLAERFSYVLERDDYSKKVDYGYEALSLYPPGHPRRTRIMKPLLASLLQQSWARGNLEEVDRSIDCMRELLQTAPDSIDSFRPDLISALSNALQRRFDMTGQLNDLTDCIRYGYDGLSLCPKGHPRRPRILTGLSFHLVRRHSETRQLEDLNSSISLLREALSLHTPESSGRIDVLNFLVQSLSARSKETKDPQDLEESMRYLEEALQLSPSQPSFLQDSAMCYLQRYDQTGELGDLDKAICYYRELLSISPDGSALSLSPGLLLSVPLLDRYRELGNLEDLDECIDLARRALSSYPSELGHSGRGRALGILTSALGIRADSTGNEADTLEVILHQKELAVSAFGSGCLSRLQTATHWASLAHDRNHPSTLEAYRTGLELLEQNFAYFPTLEMQHEAVREAGSLSSNGAAYAISQGDIKLAVEMLEQGRATLWSQVRRLRTPLDQLAADGDSIHLRDAFLEKSRALEALNTSANPFISRSGIGEGDDPYGRMLETKHRLTAELNEVIEQIRVKFPDFLSLPSYDKLKAVSAEGPVIIINHSLFRSDAIILAPGDKLRCVQLDDTFHKQAIDLSEKLLQARQVFKSSAQKEYDRVLRLTLKVLGELLVGPVVEKLRELGVEEGSRIWWCPTSVVSALPIHAAGPLTMSESKSSKSKVYLTDLYIPSYTPTLTALIEARKAPTGSGGPVERAGILGVALLDKSLQAVAGEIDVLRTRFPGDKLTLAMGNGCNRDAVVAGLAERPWVHFACHGTLKASEPFNSALILSGDERLSLLDIVKAGLHNAELAVLSACHTAEQTQDSAMDEALHLAAAMQFSGFRSVVGTMWQVQDEDGPMFAEYFYGAMFEQRGDQDTLHASEVGFKKAARALYAATKKMRRKKVDVERWVNFVHIGA
ncbi:uncharacterized protein PHACADRAFT_203794 [Phanerochaete carnosa HHB-10118-sp]|uniref:CHAT domain-containing protein n=1 Tax=Phanerochaete carnosa (strain HHB-10118-sp) TaxID=650164 RepID=K5XCB3_PHACS|nr:uncharacterized protein PHACADRAFT_203794 [Phanerochaete carnosa HHB-10118-sp]EKM60632.1 hypothetical protein PHACADRAFT_203794 [Phanerochaete carnosa HHB-10118-sp]